MFASPHGKGLLRLFLGAAFVLLGWMLASSTSAQADDRGVLATVTSAVQSTVAASEPVAAVTAPVTAVVAETTGAVPEVADVATEVVEQAVAASPVAPVAQAPVAVVAQVVEAVATSANDAVVDPVVEVVVDVVSAPAAVVTDLPDVVVPQQSSTPDLVLGELVASPTEVVVDRSRTERLLRAEARQASSDTEPTVGSSARAGAPARDVVRDVPAAPDVPEPAVPTPFAPDGAPTGAAPAAGAAPTGQDASWFGSTPQLTENSSAAGSSDPLRAGPGPAQDPGSRPG